MSLSEIADKLHSLRDAKEVVSRIEEISDLLSEMEELLEDVDDVELESYIEDYFDRWGDSEFVLEDPGRFLDETNDFIVELGHSNVLDV